jgi:hypothetical protein
VILEDQDLASDKHKNAAKAAKKFQGLKCNQPVKTPNDRKKYKVRACQDGEEKLVRFGEPGYQHYRDSPGSKKGHQDEKRRANFKARHQCDTAKDKMTPRYWACNYNW